jgi:hypothetical protein
MAKKQTAVKIKVTFGKRKGGKARKRKFKGEDTKKYRGQGR